MLGAPTPESPAATRKVRLNRVSAIVVPIAFAFLPCASTSAPRPQQFTAPKPATQSVKVEVFALDKDHQPVTDMKPEDFYLKQHKQLAKIDSVQFGASRQLNFALLFDLSGSRKMDPKYRSEFAAASDFLRRIWQEGDAASVVAFSDFSHSVMNSSQDLATAVQAVDSLSRVSPKGGTALYDVICYAALDRDSAFPASKVLIIFSDFDDDLSHNRLEQAFECALKGKIRIYSFVLLDEGPENKCTKRHSLKVAADLSEQTGGLAFVPNSTTDLSNSIMQLSQFVRSTYEITFTLPPAKPGNHLSPIDIETTRPGVKLYFPRSYYQQ